MGITSSDEPNPGPKPQSTPADSTSRAERLTPARRRLGRLIDLDERELIDLAVEVEFFGFRELPARNSPSVNPASSSGQISQTTPQSGVGR